MSKNLLHKTIGTSTNLWLSKRINWTYLCGREDELAINLFITIHRDQEDTWIQALKDSIIWSTHKKQEIAFKFIVKNSNNLKS